MSFFAIYGGIMHNSKDIKTDIDNLTEENRTTLVKYLELLKEEESLSKEKT